jgi:aspartokinase
MLDICNDHVFAAESFIKDQSLRETLIQTVKDECQELVEYIVAAKRFNLEINSRAKDRVISFGEKLSCRFMAALLQDMVSTHFRLGAARIPTPLKHMHLHNLTIAARDFPSCLCFYDIGMRVLSEKEFTEHSCTCALFKH